jgi:hypothetical protein
MGRTLLFELLGSLFSVRVHGSAFGSSFEARCSQFAEREQPNGEGNAEP